MTLVFGVGLLSETEIKSHLVLTVIVVAGPCLLGINKAHSDLLFHEESELC
jgi:hypothetical protein